MAYENANHNTVRNSRLLTLSPALALVCTILPWLAACEKTETADNANIPSPMTTAAVNKNSTRTYIAATEFEHYIPSRFVGKPITGLLGEKLSDEYVTVSVTLNSPAAGLIEILVRARDPSKGDIEFGQFLYYLYGKHPEPLEEGRIVQWDGSSKKFVANTAAVAGVVQTELSPHQVCVILEYGDNVGSTFSFVVR